MSYDKMTGQMTKEQSYFNSKMFYGYQSNQFPKRQDGKVRDEMVEEIEKQRK